MARPMGVTKRQPTYIPSGLRAWLTAYSKADLAEITYDLALRLAGGDEASPEQVKEVIEETKGVIMYALGLVDLGNARNV